MIISIFYCTRLFKEASHAMLKAYGFRAPSSRLKGVETPWTLSTDFSGQECNAMLSISNYFYAEQVLHYKIIFLPVLKENKQWRQLFHFRTIVLGNSDSFATVCGYFFYPLQCYWQLSGKFFLFFFFCRLTLPVCIYQGLLSVSKELQLQNITQLTDMA